MQLIIEDQYVERRISARLENLAQLSLADKGGRIDALDMLNRASNDDKAGRFGEPFEFVE
jgi:hypothetical protein